MIPETTRYYWVSYAMDGAAVVIGPFDSLEDATRSADDVQHRPGVCIVSVVRTLDDMPPLP